MPDGESDTGENLSRDLSIVFLTLETQSTGAVDWVFKVRGIEAGMVGGRGWVG